MRAFDEEPFVSEMRDKTSWTDRSLYEVRKKIKVHLKEICDDSCFFCKWSIRGRDVHIEHIVSKTKYKIFTYRPENLILCCSDCNSLKNKSDVFTDKVDTTLFKTWNDYPVMSDDYTIIHPYIDTYEKHLERKGVIYKYFDNKGLETIKAYNLDRLSLAEKNAKIDNFKGVVFDIQKNPHIGDKEAKRMIDEVLYPKPKYAPFDEFINVKLRGAEPFSKELIDSINCLDANKFNNFNKVINSYNGTGSFSDMDISILNDTLEIIKIINEIIKIPKDRRDVRVLCSYNIREIKSYWQKKVFRRSKNEQVLFAIKFLNILGTLNRIDFIEKNESIIQYISKLIQDLNNTINNVGA